MSDIRQLLHNHLIGASRKRQRKAEVERLGGGLEVGHKLELDWFAG